MPRHHLDDADYAAFAWGRFRRILRWMALVSALAAAGAVGLLRWWTGPMPLHMVIATLIGVGLSVLLGTALMGLVFLSSGSGHDAAVDRINDTNDPGRRP